MKEEVSLSKDKLNFLVIILAFCVVLVGIGGFWLGTHFGDSKTIVESKNKEKEIIEDNGINLEEVDKLGKRLFEKTSSSYANQNYYFYGDGIAISDFDKYALGSAIIEVAFQDNLIIDNSETCDLKDKLGIEPTCYKYQLKVEDYDKIAKDLFGANYVVKHEEFVEYNRGLDCKFENDYINFYQIAGGDSLSGQGVIKYKESILDNDTLYVYANSLYLKLGGGLYSDLDGKNLIIENVMSDYFATGIIDKDKLFEDYSDKAGTYQLTFKKDTNENWYWVTTKLMA